MTFDLDTLFVVSQLISALCGVLFLAEYFRPGSNHNRWFALALILVPVAPLFYYAASSSAALWWLYPVGNGVATLALSITLMGAREFAGRATPVWIGPLSTAVMVGATIAFPQRTDAWAGVVPFLLLFGVLNLLCAIEFWRGTSGERRLRNAGILTLTSGIGGLFYIARAVAFVLLGPDDPTFLAVFGPEVATLVVLVLVVASTFSLISLAKERADRLVRHAATHDPLTDALNRREFERRVVARIAALSQHDAPSALLLLDLDHFKLINDEHGHLVGDQILASFSRVACSSLRKGDLFCRYGGEEFAVYLPGADQAAGVAVGERIRTALLRSDEPVLRAVRPTVSIGVTDAPQSELALQALVAEADRALYRAKSAGRDRIVASEPALATAVALR